MTDLLAKLIALLIGGAILWSLWRAAQGRAVFLIQITDGEPHAVAGTVTAAFLARVREVTAGYGVRSGQVRGLARGTRIRLEFSRHIPEAVRQQLRNWWVLSGWRAGKGRA
ncbi:MAG TPA: DUF3634 family protein [Gemmataceae bacterium]|nr:DUF3634 family protein [Gemmataceae bacterium]